jgi:hypothetical protein
LIEVHSVSLSTGRRFIFSIFESRVSDFTGFSLKMEAGNFERASCGLIRETGAVQ